MRKKKALINWSGGKDSCFSLYKIRQAPQAYSAQWLLTSFSEEYDRVSMHGVRRELIQAQARSIGIPLEPVFIRSSETMDEYEKKMNECWRNAENKGVEASIFGDIFLEDLRAYREKQLSKTNIETVFPLWGTPTDELVRAFIDTGFKAIVTCVSEKYLAKDFVGRILDEYFLEDLPSTVDPCGERGEFHTFVFDGPLFSNPISFQKGEIVYRSYPAPAQSAQPPESMGFWYIDLF